MSLTAPQKLRHLILCEAAKYEKIDISVIAAENIDDIYFDSVASSYEDEIRAGTVETDIDTPYSRHYENKAVATQYLDGSWVGWTYWYGGGKHGNPEEIVWVDYAYDLDCVEEPKVVVIRTFSRPDRA